jgi:hypothetical protein
MYVRTGIPSVMLKRFSLIYMHRRPLHTGCNDFREMEGKGRKEKWAIWNFIHKTEMPNECTS